MLKHVFVTRKIPEVGIEMLRKNGYVVDIYPKDKIISKKELISCLKKKQYDAVVCLLTDKIDKDVFDVAPSVKLFANYATGYDNIDIIEAKKRGVVVSNAPSELASESVAEHAMALILALTTRLVEADKYVRQGKYKGWSPMNFIGTNFSDKTLGLIGVGSIGSKVACYAKALGLQVVYFDVNRNLDVEERCGARFISDVDEVLVVADIVSLHVPLLNSTRHLIDERRLRLMKSTSFLVNTSRGGVIDEKALERILRKDVIRGAGLDVFEYEPKLSKGLSKLKNVVLTPHIASASDEARNEMAKIVAENIIDFFEGKVPRNIITLK